MEEPRPRAQPAGHLGARRRDRRGLRRDPPRRRSRSSTSPPRPHRSRPTIDPERAAKVSGTRFVYRLGDVALLELSLYRWALTRLVEKGFVPMLPPVLVREQAMYGTGFFPTESSNI